MIPWTHWRLRGLILTGAVKYASICHLAINLTLYNISLSWLLGGVHTRFKITRKYESMKPQYVLDIPEFFDMLKFNKFALVLDSQQI
jgi:hypothetical protein